MKKVLFAINSDHFSKAAFEFVLKMNEQEPILVAAVYVPAFASELAYATPGGAEAIMIPQIIEEQKAMMWDGIHSFQEACIANGLEFRIHGDVGYTIAEGLEHETRFADLLVIGYEGYYKQMDKEYMQDEIKHIVEKSECPVVLVPESASFPDSVVIAYDGSADSVYAMKMFSYIFPQMKSAKAILTYVGKDNKPLPEGDYVKELAARHFSDLTLSKMEYDKKYFSLWLVDRPNSLLVAGAYGRGELSQLFRKSFVAEVLKEHVVPVFIAHR